MAITLEEKADPDIQAPPPAPKVDRLAAIRQRVSRAFFRAKQNPDTEDGTHDKPLDLKNLQDILQTPEGHTSAQGTWAKTFAQATENLDPRRMEQNVAPEVEKIRLGIEALTPMAYNAARERARSIAQYKDPEAYAAAQKLIRGERTNALGLLKIGANGVELRQELVKKGIANEHDSYACVAGAIAAHDATLPESIDPAKAAEFRLDYGALVGLDHRSNSEFKDARNKVENAERKSNFGFARSLEDRLTSLNEPANAPTEAKPQEVALAIADATRQADRVAQRVYLKARAAVALNPNLPEDQKAQAIRTIVERFNHDTNDSNSAIFEETRFGSVDRRVYFDPGSASGLRFKEAFIDSHLLDALPTL